MMTRSEFENFLLVHGSNIDQWPNELSTPARGRLENDPSAREFLRNLREIDDHIADALKVRTLGAALTGRVLTRVSERSGDGNPGEVPFRPGFVTAIGSTLAVTMLGLGFFIGSFDLAWLDGASASELSLLLFGETEYLMDTL